MKLTHRIFLGLAIFLGLGLAGKAQTAPPVQHFVISGSAAGQPSAIATAGVQLTSSVSVVYEYVSNPSDSTKTRIGSGLANYTFGADKLVPKSVKSKLLLDVSNYLITLQAGAGRTSEPGANGRVSHIVGNFGAYGGYALPGGHSQLGVGYKWIVGPGFDMKIKVPVGNLTFTF